MAIDSAEKRKAVAGIPFFPLGPNVTPNASRDAQWRQQVAWSYSGIAAGTPPEGVGGDWLHIHREYIDFLVRRQRIRH